MKLFNYPIIRHLVAGVVIAILLNWFFIAPLHRQNKELQHDLVRVTEELAKRPTYTIDNKVSAHKMKQGSTIKMIPDNTLEVENTDVDVVQSKAERKDIRKHWWQFWKKRK